MLLHAPLFSFLITLSPILIVEATQMDIYYSWIKDFNKTPNSVFYGLLSNDTKSPASAEGITLLHYAQPVGTCLWYDPTDFNRCIFYSDCCPFVSAKKQQLPPHTFTFHAYFYLSGWLLCGEQVSCIKLGLLEAHVFYNRPQIRYHQYSTQF